MKSCTANFAIRRRDILGAAIAALAATKKFATHKALLAAAMCGIIGLVLGGPALGAETDGNYTGKRVLMKGASQICGPTEEDVSVSISFTRKEYQATIGFVPDPGGSFTGTFQDMGGDTMILRGLIVGDLIDADITNQGCEYHWHLQRNK